jgi:hypothetical protein
MNSVPEKHVPYIPDRWWLRFVALVLLVLTVSGCGRGAGDVSGKVSFKGSPLTGGWVTFNYPNGKHTPVSGAIGPDGTYRIAGCPAGEARLTVRAASKQGKKANGPKPPPIPVRFADPEKTDLVVTVKGGSQRLDLELKP